ncbi:enolase C-terminal domain-like protein [Tritonibacter sp. SIMBA_163]
MIESKLVDVLGVDPGRAEGITGFQRICGMAEAARVTVNAHAWSTAAAG